MRSEADMAISKPEMILMLARMKFLAGYRDLDDADFGEYYRILGRLAPWQVDMAVTGYLGSGKEFFPPPGALSKIASDYVQAETKYMHDYGKVIAWLNERYESEGKKSLPAPSRQAIEAKESPEAEEERAQAFFQANPRLRVSMGPKPSQRAHRAPERREQ